MAKFKKGDVLTCEVCGLVVVVDDSCGCAVGEIICCKKQPMAKGKAVADKAKKKKAAAKATDEKSRESKTGREEGRKKARDKSKKEVMV